MPVKRRRRNPLSRLIAPCATFALLGYFGFHALHGQYGIRAQMVMKEQIKVLDASLERKRLARVQRESRLTLLQEGGMQHDMVDEYARKQLGMARSGQIVIIFN